MGSDRDDELARTATAAPPTSSVPSLGATLGRYRLEGELGAGGMGVVHAAFDPDLERRIALKVLKVSAPSVEAKDRLMREARAMARLSHPNVVTVHEVGTAHGRDFVAMELIHGETLASWLRAEPRPAVAVIDAFVAAGRGIAAAHAAGIVHRDFKPHNVLRSRDGRIVVTDFGLAREAEGALPTGLETTLPVALPTASGSAPSALSGLTMTGALLGTPAYMAPEQWNRGAVTPATDQFAYCVALWEALAGERPYVGPTLDDLRAQVARGPAALDASKIPRRLRGTLRRGLDPAPGARWPSMDALLARLVRAERRPGIAIALIAGALVAAGVLLIALRGRDAPVIACEPPARDVATVWSPAIADPLRGRQPAEARVLDAALRDWQAARTQACAAPPNVRQAQLQCLDGVLARVDAVRQAFLPAGTAEGIQGQLIDPVICRRPAAADVPRLTLAATPDVIAAYQQYSQIDADPTPSDAALGAMLARPALEPCARVIATLAFRAVSKDIPRVRSTMSDAVSRVDQCGDDRLRADLLIQDSQYQYELPMVGARGEAAIRQAQAAAARVMQPDVDAALAEPRIFLAHQNQRWDEAFRLADAELAGYQARGLVRAQVRAVIHRNRLRLLRVGRGDLEAVVADVATWRPIAVAAGKAKLVAQLDIFAARARYGLGDVVAAHADLLRLWRAQPGNEIAGPSREITGEVLDEHGRPVAGAEVAAGSQLGGDSVSVAVPLIYDYDESLQIVTTDATGHFAIHGGAVAGAIIAQHGALRSLPAAIADHVRLTLAPTRRVTGKVDLGDQVYTQVAVAYRPRDTSTVTYGSLAPVAPDGSFVLDGASVGPLAIGISIGGGDGLGRASASNVWPASRAAIRDLRLAVPSSHRSVDVIVRSQMAAPLDGAQVIVLAGKQKITTVDQLLRRQAAGLQVAFARPIVGENVPAGALAKARTGDLVAHLDQVSLGELTACAVAVTSDFFDPVALKRLQAHIAELAVRCEIVPPDGNLVVVLVPPQQRFD